MKNVNLVLLLFSMSLISSCGLVKEQIISPGRVSKGNLDKHYKAFKKVCDTVNNPTIKEIEMIGHGAGSWRYYPMGINKNGVAYGNGYSNKKTPALGIKKLIDISISINSKMAIELDAHLAHENHLIKSIYPNDGAYILHDEPQWKRKRFTNINALKYLHENSLAVALKHIANKDYYQNCKVYVEIKVPKKYYNSNEKEELLKLCEKLSKELGYYSKTYKRLDGKNWLSITSFSHTALTYFHDSLEPELQKQFDYTLILGYKGFWNSLFASCKGYVPRFNENILNFMIKTEWLNSVWFSAQGIKNYHNEFNKITKSRRTHDSNFKDLIFSFSTYQYSERKMVRKLLRHKNPEYSFGSFMVDVDY